MLDNKNTVTDGENKNMIVDEELITEHNRIMIIERRKNFYLLRKILRNGYIWTKTDFLSF